MANPEHVRLLLQEGVAAWNQLRHTDQVKADFSGADLSHANLAGADLRFADLRGVNLRGASLVHANLSESRAAATDLRWADLRSACLQTANLSGATLQATQLEHANLRFTKGLESCKHLAPSGVNYVPLQTLSESAEIPVTFLRGCGLGDEFIEYLVSVHRSSTQTYSCFIAFGPADRSFAVRLREALRGLGIFCWLDERQDLKEPADQSSHPRRLWVREVLCCSAHTLASGWVVNEIITAREEKQRVIPQVCPLVLVDLDGYIVSDWDGGGYLTTLRCDQFKMNGIYYWRSSELLDFTAWAHDSRKFEKQVALLSRLIQQPLTPEFRTSSA